jgi:small subunit ribosomal protein S6
MPEGAPIYDLMLLLSTEAPEEQRAKILSDVESAISSSGGSIERRNDWGQRALSFRINHESTADYHLLQFFGPPALLESLSHDLKITDGVLRFRIIKVLPGTPSAPESAPPVIAPVTHASPPPREDAIDSE